VAIGTSLFWATGQQQPFQPSSEKKETEFAQAYVSVIPLANKQIKDLMPLKQATRESNLRQAGSFACHSFHALTHKMLEIVAAGR